MKLSAVLTRLPDLVYRSTENRGYRYRTVLLYQRAVTALPFISSDRKTLPCDRDVIAV